MDIFFSWSGKASGAFAKKFGGFLRNVIQSIDTFISTEDIRSGSRWFNEISVHLDKTKFGIICLTPKNIDAPWILFEAGALAKVMDDSHVVPICIGLKKTALTAPLSQFQSVEANKEEIEKLVLDINKALEKPINEEIIKETIDRFWDKAEEAIAEALKLIQEDTTPSVQTRSTKDMLEELLATTRGISHQLNTMNSSLPPYPSYSVGHALASYDAYANPVMSTASSPTLGAIDLGRISLGQRISESIQKSQEEALRKSAIALRRQAIPTPDEKEPNPSE